MKRQLVAVVAVSAVIALGCIVESALLAAALF
jgi:hypothetical protein